MPWDHKDQIKANWGKRTNVTFGDQTWAMHHDVWSNIHYGFITADTGGLLDDLSGDAFDPWVWCQANCPLAGKNNPLDTSYVEAGIELHGRLNGDPLTREFFDEWILGYLPVWTRADDNTRPVLVD